MTYNGNYDSFHWFQFNSTSENCPKILGTFIFHSVFLSDLLMGETEWKKHRQRLRILGQVPLSAICAKDCNWIDPIIEPLVPFEQLCNF